MNLRAVFCELRSIENADERARLMDERCAGDQRLKQQLEGLFSAAALPEDVLAIPKVIDFGVAKAMQQPLIENSVYTGLSQMIGTPLPLTVKRLSRPASTRCDASFKKTYHNDQVIDIAP